MPSIFVSIAVSKPNGLAELPGALTAGTRLRDWAVEHGYISVHVDDSDSAVTVDRLRERITQAIEAVTDEQVLDRIVIFFAGHGASFSVGDHYWILSNWNQRTSEAIKVSALQRALEYYGPKQVAIIGDACQEFSSRFKDLVGSAILDIPSEEPQPYELDQFLAVDVGQQAFMIKGTDAEGDFCVFTEVLLDALEADVERRWFDPVGERLAITSQSLARYLLERVVAEAGVYGLKMTPRPRPGFFTNTVYAHALDDEAEAAAPGAGTIDLAGSEEPTFELHGTDIPPDVAAEPNLKELSAPVEEIGRINARPIFEQWEGISPRGTSEASSIRLPLPPRARRSLRPRFEPPSLPSTEAPSWSADEVDRRSVRETEYETQLREHAIASIQFSPPCGISITGAEVVSVSVRHGLMEQVDNTRYSLTLPPDSRAAIAASADTLVTLSNGRHFPLCCVDGFVTDLQVLNESTFSVRHRPSHVSTFDLNDAIEVLARAHAGQLSVAEAIRAGHELRQEKHLILTLGCIAAQLFDLSRDIDSLRSMAAFYARRGQPLPLDIALYGGAAIGDYDGRLYARIPLFKHDGEAFDKSADPAAQRYIENHPIAGRVPWMRHAWGAVATAQYDRNAWGWKGKAMAAMAYLAPGIFTNFESDQQLVAELAGIRLG